MTRLNFRDCPRCGLSGSWRRDGDGLCAMCEFPGPTLEESIRADERLKMGEPTIVETLHKLLREAKDQAFAESKQKSEWMANAATAMREAQELRAQVDKLGKSLDTAQALLRQLTREGLVPYGAMGGGELVSSESLRKKLFEAQDYLLEEE